MNTPAHLLVNCTALGNGAWQAHSRALVLGSVVPDAPLHLLYGMSLLQRRSEAQSWNQNCFHGAWGRVFDLVHRLPLAALVALAGDGLGAGAAAFGGWLSARLVWSG